MADLEQIVNQLSDLTVIEAAELSKLLEEKWGVSAAAPVAAAAAIPAGEATEEEKDDEQLENCFKKIESEIVRDDILNKGKRIDGRKLDKVRQINSETRLLPRTHGSSPVSYTHLTLPTKA